MFKDCPRCGPEGIALPVADHKPDVVARSVAITRECYAALESAIALHEKSGFRRTGRKREYGGITVFEMAKIL